VTKARLISGIASLGAPTRGSFFRAIPLVHINSPLSAIGSHINGGRYNPISAFEVLYAAQERDTVPRETRAIIVDPVSGALISTSQPPSIYLTINVVLRLVVDLTDSAVCGALAINPKDLLVEWRDLVALKKRVATHIIGAAALKAGVEALLVPSARLSGTKNIAILVDNLRVGSSIEVDRPEGFPPGTPTRIDGSV
jgi:RES domain-containing protein